MLKKIFLLLTTLFVLTSCDKKVDKIYLNSEYYDGGSFIELESEEVEKLSSTYILYTYNNFCSFPKPCEDVFKGFMEKYKINFIKITYDEFKKTSLHNTVRYAPSVLIVSNNEVISYLDAEKDKDVDKYQDVDAFTDWVSKYVYLEKEEN